MIVFLSNQSRAHQRSAERTPVSSKNRAGIAVVEAALVAPLLVLILLGILELGRGIAGKETLSNAARKGCRTGIQRTTGSIDIYNDTVNIMRDNGYTAAQFNPAPLSGQTGTPPYIGSITITVTDPSGNTLSDALGAPSGSVVSVQVAIPASSVMWISAYYLAGTVESELVVMMKQ